MVLVYPMREYTTTGDDQMLREMYFGDVFVKEAINNGFPLATVVSTDNYMKHSDELYSECILVVPAALENDAVKAKLANYARSGGKIITYGSKKALETVPYGCVKADIDGPVKQLLDAFEQYGYSIRYNKADEESLLPTATLHRSDNAMIFNVYNRDTTVEARYKFPLGAPVINGYNTLLVDGYATYHFPRSVHGECRVFVKQDSGVVRAREMTPANRKYRRRIKVSGLKNAEVCLFPESYCIESASAADFEYSDATPVLKRDSELVHDPEYGSYIRVKNVSGDLYLVMPFADMV